MNTTNASTATTTSPSTPAVTTAVSTIEDYSEYQLAVSLWLYVSPVLLVVGTVGNILALIVLSRPAIRHSTTSLYLRLLAVMDTIVLNTGLLRYWLIYLVQVDVREMSEVSCKVNVWVLYVSAHSSAWLLVAVTLERVLSVTFPHKVKLRCTRKAAYAIISSILVFFILLDGHYLYGIGDVHKTEGNKTSVVLCDSQTPSYLNFEAYFWPWVDLAFYSTIPSSIMIISNFIIIKKVINTNREALRMRSYNGDIKNRKQTMSSMTLTLVVVSATYVICTTPFCALVIYLNMHEGEESSSQTDAVTELMWAIVNFVQYTNNCINFVLYCVTGTRFRHELRKLFCPGFSAQRPVTFHSTSRHSEQNSDNAIGNTQTVFTVT